MKNLQLITYGPQHSPKQGFGVLLLILFSTFYFLFSGVTFADTAEPQDFVYVFHLYYDNGQLVVDRNAQFKYDVLPETFVPETLNTQFPYKGEVINLKGEVAEVFQFNPQRDDSRFLKGTLSVKAPYVPDGQKVNFYDSQGNQLISIFVSESSFCNDDGVCNPDVGEDAKTCSNDCRETMPVPTVITETSGDGQGGMLMMLIYVLITAGVGLGGWFGWKWWQKGKQSSVIEISTNLSPTPPSSQNSLQ